ncbi:phosphotransferase, partial [Flavobacteriaceae bacterium F89]
MDNYSDLRISTQKAQDLLRDLFNIGGRVSPLPGDSDFNFRVGTDDGEGYILKISRPGEVGNYLDFQQQLLTYIDKNQKDLISPKVVKDKNGNPVSSFLDAFGNQRSVRLLTWVSGRLWSSVNPQRDGLRCNLGEQCGRLTSALQGFEHREAHRQLEWDVAKSLWTENHLDLFSGDKREVVSYFQEKFKSRLDSYKKLRKSVVHNDANDNNVIVSSDLKSPKVKAVIDYGDTVYTQIINDVAIACAYAVMHHNDPLAAALPIVTGYHATFPLEAGELEHLYSAMAMRLVVSVTKSALNKMAEPENEYLLISERPAWDLLRKWRNIDPDFAHFSFRQACGFPAHPD